MDAEAYALLCFHCTNIILVYLHPFFISESSFDLNVYPTYDETQLVNVRSSWNGIVSVCAFIIAYCRPVYFNPLAAKPVSIISFFTLNLH